MILINIVLMFTMFLFLTVDIFLSKIPLGRDYENEVLNLDNNLRINQSRQYNERDECMQILINICKLGHLFCGKNNVWNFLTDLGSINQLSVIRQSQTSNQFSCGNLQSYQRYLYNISAIGRLRVCDNYFYDLSGLNFNVSEPCAISDFVRVGGTGW